MRIALFGSGWIMDFHARGVIEHPGGELVAAANWREASLRSLAERHGIPRITTDWRELVSDPEVDAVIIACLAVSKLGLVQIPRARPRAAPAPMNAAAAASGKRLMVAHCWRFHDDVRALRARIAGGELGEITKTRGYGVHAGWGPSGWFTDPELAGGGALLDMGVHAIDTVRFLLGDPALESVCARIATRYGDYAVDDDGVLLIGWANGTSSLVESGWWHPHLAGLEADTEVYGTAGYARIWDFTEGPEGYEHCAQPMYSAQVAEFIDAVSEGRQPRPSGEDGAVVMDAVDRAYRSAGIR